MNRSRTYYGWVMVTLAAAAMVGTLPGRTQGLGLVTEPLLADLRIGRVGYAQLNLWATLIGSAFAIGIGRIVDWLGTRLVLTIVAMALGITVIGMAHVQTFWGLAIAVTLTRGLGPSALSVISIAMVGHWFVRRIDAALAVTPSRDRPRTTAPSATPRGGESPAPSVLRVARSTWPPSA